MLRLACFCFISLFLLSACFPSGSNNNNPSPHPNIWQPKPGTSWQIQLQGNIDTSFDVDLYVLDLFDTPVGVINGLHSRGIKVVCYFSAGTWEDWRDDAGKFPQRVIGKKLPEWEGEWWLDFRQSEVHNVMQGRLDKAVAKGCDGVDPDNVDSYTHDTGFPLSAGDQIDYSIFLANEAHARGLSIGLKNNLNQIGKLEPYHNWIINEQCFVYSECDLLLPFIRAGKPVFGIEYETAIEDFCPKANAMDFDFLKKNLDLKAHRIACR